MELIREGENRPITVNVVLIRERIMKVLLVRLHQIFVSIIYINLGNS